jgi:hypothetical protein
VVVPPRPASTTSGGPVTVEKPKSRPGCPWTATR